MCLFYEYCFIKILHTIDDIKKNKDIRIYRLQKSITKFNTSIKCTDFYFNCEYNHWISIWSGCGSSQKCCTFFYRGQAPHLYAANNSSAWVLRRLPLPNQALFMRVSTLCPRSWSTYCVTAFSKPHLVPYTP